MLYQIIFRYTDPENGKQYNFSGIKEGSTPGEAKYYFLRKYPHSNIEILKTTPLIID